MKLNKRDGLFFLGLCLERRQKRTFCALALTTLQMFQFKTVCEQNVLFENNNNDHPPQGNIHLKKPLSPWLA